MRWAPAAAARQKLWAARSRPAAAQLPVARGSSMVGRLPTARPPPLPAVESSSPCVLHAPNPLLLLRSDSQLRAVVLAIRGTHSFKDMFTSLTGGGGRGGRGRGQASCCGMHGRGMGAGTLVGRHFQRFEGHAYLHGPLAHLLLAHVCRPPPAGASKPHHLVDANGVVLGYSHFGMLAAARWIQGQTRQRLEQALADNPGGWRGRVHQCARAAAGFCFVFCLFVFFGGGGGG
jgi:hypothetical protein